MALLVLAGVAALAAPESGASGRGPRSSAQPATAMMRMCSPERGATTVLKVNGRRVTVQGGSCAAFKAKAGVNIVGVILRPRQPLVKVSVVPQKDLLNVGRTSNEEVLRLRVGSAGVSLVFYSKPQTGPGWLEVCAWPYDGGTPPPGDITFTVTAGKTASTLEVATGTCSTPLFVKASKPTIAETVPAGYVFRAADTIPSVDLESVDFWTATATISIPAGLIVQTDFYNSPN